MQELGMYLLPSTRIDNADSFIGWHDWRFAKTTRLSSDNLLEVSRPHGSALTVPPDLREATGIKRYAEIGNTKFNEYCRRR